jgi:hypothetical protein
MADSIVAVAVFLTFQTGSLFLRDADSMTTVVVVVLVVLRGINCSSALVLMELPLCAGSLLLLLVIKVCFASQANSPTHHLDRHTN